jgi:hypothetical protein
VHCRGLQQAPAISTLKSLYRQQPARCSAVDKLMIAWRGWCNTQDGCCCGSRCCCMLSLRIAVGARLECGTNKHRLDCAVLAPAHMHAWMPCNAVLLLGLQVRMYWFTTIMVLPACVGADSRYVRGCAHLHLDRFWHVQVVSGHPQCHQPGHRALNHSQAASTGAAARSFELLDMHKSAAAAAAAAAAQYEFRTCDSAAQLTSEACWQQVPASSVTKAALCLLFKTHAYGCCASGCRELAQLIHCLMNCWTNITQPVWFCGAADKYASAAG